MEAQDALTQLADIHLPEDVGWWPPAPGWWLLGLLLLAALAVAVFLGWQHYRRRRRLAAALNTLDEAQRRYRDRLTLTPGDDQAALDFVSDINQTLRRVALLYFSPQEIASLSGRSWLDFLDRSDPHLDFHDEAVSCLGDMAYRRTFSGDPEPAYRLARRWIRHRYLGTSLWRDALPGRRQSYRPGGNTT